MMELTIDNQVYQFNFGMRFLVDINKMSKASANGIEKLFDDVMGFFERANATKVMTKNFLNALEKGKATESPE